MKLTEEQRRRYSRHILLPEIGEEGQGRLLRSRVFIAGAGGLGSAAGYYLAAAGVGTLGIIDDDEVELSNLQRQIAHSTRTLGTQKVKSAKNTFESLNPDIKVVAIGERLSKGNILGLIKDYDAVVDCSDNFETRFLINDACVILGRPLITGAVSGFEGQLTSIIPRGGPCYRCLFEGPPPDSGPSRETGLPGFLPGVIGTLQAAEVIKLILGIGETLRGHLLIYDALKQNFRKIVVPRNPDCPVCGDSPGITDVNAPLFRP